MNLTLFSSCWRPRRQNFNDSSFVSPRYFTSEFQSVTGVKKREIFEMQNPIRAFFGLLVAELIVVLGGFGISAWFYSQVPNPRNIFAILPLSFLG